MIAIDTNVLVRVLLRDDAAQTAIADALFETETMSGLNTPIGPAGHSPVMPLVPIWPTCCT